MPQTPNQRLENGLSESICTVKNFAEQNIKSESQDIFVQFFDDFEEEEPTITHIQYKSEEKCPSEEKQ